MKKCIVCQNFFENLSEEHIIPNALGGRLKSKNLTCRECNRAFSDNFESDFIHKYKIFMYTAGLEQERGTGQALNLTTTNNEKIKYYPDKMVFDQHGMTIDEKENGIQYRIQASSLKEARSRIDELIKLYPQSKDMLEDQKKNLKIQHKYLNNPVRSNIQFNDIDQKSIGKIILSYLFLNYPQIKLSNISPFKLLDAENCRNVFLAFSTNGTLVSGINTNLYHLLVLKSFSDKKLLVGYVELFGFLSAAVLIDENYQGTQEVESVYLYDLKEQKVLSNDFVLMQNIDSIDFSNPPYTDSLVETFKERLGHTISEILDIERKREISRLVDSYCKNSENIKPGEVLTEKHIGELTNTLMPFFMSQLSTRFSDEPDMNEEYLDL